MEGNMPLLFAGKLACERPCLFSSLFTGVASTSVTPRLFFGATRLGSGFARLSFSRVVAATFFVLPLKPVLMLTSRVSARLRIPPGPMLRDRERSRSSWSVAESDDFVRESARAGFKFER